MAQFVSTLEMMRHLVLAPRNSVCALLFVNEPRFQKLMHINQPIDLFGMPTAIAEVGTVTNIFLIHLRFWRVMKILATRITKELKSASQCGVYEPELERIWPDSESRQAQIALFAKKHGWRLRFYKHDFCAIFDKEPSSKDA
jgi:hypothetical protein